MSHVHGSGWPAAGVVCGGCMTGLGDGDVDKGLDGVVLGGRLYGGGSCWGEGGSGWSGCGVLAWVWFRVRVRAGSSLLPCYRSWFLGLCGVVLVMLLVVVLVVVLLRAML